ncbi:protein abnormal spindle [Microplitis mediator]|uniref:protein abnormal spindle n=1 Tax=Microplitis mediator TaxID=375433 RepID=UPI0025541DE6|nr:protein abnormal spindle [Microplitis mediator]
MYFQVNITPKAKELPASKEKIEEPPPVLVLAPFQPQVHVNLKTTINTFTSATFIIKNPSNKQLTLKTSKLPPAERLIVLESNEFKINGESEKQVTLSWTPQDAGTWRDTLQFTDNRRIKYDVALTATSIDNKKGLAKGKSKILTQSNVNNDSRYGNQSNKFPMSSMSINPVPVKKSVPVATTQVKRADKENVTNIINDVHQTPDNNLRNKQQKPTGRSNVLMKLDFSDFQLTPLKGQTSSLTEIPEIKLDDEKIVAVGLRSSSALPDIQVFEPSEVDFSPRDSRISSPIDDRQQLRRETYLTQPKFTERMIIIDEEKNHQEKQEEIFDDSLSPPQILSKEEPHNFSAIINNINFTTPMKTIKSPGAWSTECKSTSSSEYFSIQSNDTFSISEKSPFGSFKLNSTYELLPSPGGNDQTSKFSQQQQQQQHHQQNLQTSNEQLRKSPISFELSTTISFLNDFKNNDKIINSKNLSSTITSGGLKENSQSSPVSFDQSRLSLSQSVRNGDNASAKQVLEADLWATGNRDHASFNNNLSTFSRSRCNLEMISEESNIRRTQTYKVNKPVNKIFNEYSNQEDQVEARCIEISPPKRLRRIETAKKPSPIKHNKIMKDKTIVKNSILNMKKVQSNVKRGNLIIPGVRMSKLSLSGLKSESNVTSTNKSMKVTRDKDKLYSTDNIIAQVTNPFVSIKGDPFLAYSLHYDENFLVNQEEEYTKWLNKLLTPPEQLDTDVEQVPIDIGKIWQSCRTKGNVLAETKEQVSARYHTNTRLNTLRKAAAAMLTKEEVTIVLTQVTACINKGLFVIRQDRDLHRDIGLQKEILQLFLSYNPLWLRIGLEVIYNERINLHSNNDIIGLTKFIMSRFFSDPYLVQTYSVHNVTTLRTPEFREHMNKFILKKFLFLVYFLDYVKRNKLIAHDPCLFLKKANIKDSREILLTFSRHLLSGVGDITKILRNHGYTVSHKQNYIDEYDYAVNNIGVDLRDGVRLCRVMELIKNDKTLTGRCRVPAISRLQKVFNVELALTALSESGYSIAGDIDAKSIADGHREKTLSLLWQIIYKFQAPRFEKASNILQKWWRSKLWFIRIRNYLLNRKNNAASVIQRTWKCYCARKLLEKLREERVIFLEKLEKSTRFIQQCWLRKKQMLKDRRIFMDKKAAAICIQRWFRRIRTSRPYLQDLQRKRQAVIILQNQWRAVVIMRRERNNYIIIKQAAIIIQQWWRASSLKCLTHNYYKELKAATVLLQTKWRARKLMIEQRADYLKIIEAAVKIQSSWRCYLVGKRIRNDYLVKKDAVRVIKSWWVGCKLRDDRRNEFLNIRTSVIKIQRAWKKYRETKDYVSRFKSCRKAVAIIQPWWRMIKVARKYQLQRKSAIVCQRWWRSILITRNMRNEFVEVKRAAILVQKNWKMKKERRNYLRLKEATIKIEKWYCNVKHSRTVRHEYVEKKKAAIFIQNWWRCLKITRECRDKYLADRRAAIVIQNHWRAKVIGKFLRQKYLEMRVNVIKLQAFWRMVSARRNYLNALKKHKAAVTIQSRWRAKIIGFKIRESFIKQRQAAIFIQHKYRAIKIARVVRMQYNIYKKSTIIIQKNWRMIKATREFQRQRKAAIVIQSHWRARVIGLRTRAFYIKQRSAAVVIQRKYRGIKIGRVIKTQYVVYKKAAVVIQKNWRMIKTFREYQQQRKAAITLQTQWRARVVGLKTRDSYIRQRSAAVIIQRRYRAIKIAKVIKMQYQVYKKAAIIIQKNLRMIRAYRNYQQRRKAAVVLQAHWRARVIGLETRDLYIKQRSAAIVIQRKYRAFKVGRAVKLQYVAYKKSAIIIQKNWKMFKLSQDFQQLRTAAIILQSQWRARKLSIKFNQEYKLIRKTTVMIQQRYRARKVAREIRKCYLETRESAIKLQSLWRANKLMKETRHQYLRYRNAAICLQSKWRMIVTRRQYLIKKNAVIKIQLAWRQLIISRNIRNNFLAQRTAALFIQRRYRSIRNCQKIRRNFIKLKSAVVFVQNRWRSKLQLRKTAEDIARQRKLISAATIIQSAYRGFIVRKHQSEEIRKVRERAKQASQVAVPSQTVENRLQDAMSTLQNIKSIGQLSMCLACIDTLTRLSPKGCKLFCELNLIDTIYDILGNSNRSLPWMEVCLRCTSILITIIKLPQLSSYVRNIDETETIARLMNAMIKSNVELFLHLATLLWLLIRDNDFADQVKESPRIKWLIRSTAETNLKKDKINFNKIRNSSLQHTMILPNEKPDWGLRTRRPRYFTTVSHALSTLVEILNITI